MKKDRRLRDIVIMTVAVFTVLVVGFLVAGNVVVNNGRYLNNTKINGVDISGLTKEEALQKLMQNDAEQLSYVDIPVTCNGVTKVFTAADASASTNTEDTFLAALDNVEQAQNMSSKLDELYKMREGVEVSSQIAFDRNVLLQSVQAYAQQFDVAPQDAKAVFDADKETFEIQADVPGEYVDAEELTQRIWDQMQTRNNSAVNVSTKPLQAASTKEQLEDSTQLIGTYSTNLKDDDDRNTNVDLVCEKLNGTELKPNEVLSINDLTGPRTEEKGYKEAEAIVYGMITEDFGGGVCQVSSTLYYAALLADCKIVERHHHTWPSSYTTVGLDATIDYDSEKDLKIQNVSNYPMYISAKRNGLTLTVNIYGGLVRDGVKITIESEELSSTDAPKPEVIYDDTLPKGEKRVIQQEHEGHKVRVVRKYYKQNELVDTELISTDTYRAIGSKYRLGTGASADAK